jgi:hypothetical protein
VSGAGLLDPPLLLLYVVPYWESKAALMQMLFWRNNIEDGNCRSPGLFAAPELELSNYVALLFNMIRINCTP